MDKYEHDSVVGEGSYGVVLKCRQKETGRLVAIKKFLETDEDPTVKKIAMREIRMLKRLRHENLINLIEVFRRRRKLFLVFEYVDHTVLDELESNPRGLAPDVCRCHVFQVLRGIEFCHHNNIIHRDVKPENVLVSDLGVVKLCDFGFARLMAAPGEAYTDYVATRWYRAPELLVGDSQYGKEVDIWAIGCLYAEMRTGDPLFPGESDIDQLYLITQILGPLSPRHRQLIARNPMFSGLNISMHSQKSIKQTFSEWSDESRTFLEQCLFVDQTSRPDASTLLQMSFFTHDNFHIMFPLQIRTKIQQEFGHSSGGHQLILGSKGIKKTEKKTNKLSNEEKRAQAKKDLIYRRKSETFDTLLGGGPGSARPGNVVNGIKNSQQSTNFKGLKGSIRSPILSEEKPDSPFSMPPSDGRQQQLSLSRRKLDDSPGRLRRFETFEQDLNKVTMKSAAAKTTHFPLRLDESPPSSSVGGGQSSSSSFLKSAKRKNSNNNNNNSNNNIGSEEAKLGFETTFDQAFHIDEGLRPLSRLPQNSLNNEVGNLSQPHTTALLPSLKVLKKRRQTEPVSLPSVHGAAKLKSEGLRSLPNRKRLSHSEQDQNDENSLLSPTALPQNLPYV